MAHLESDLGVLAMDEINNVLERAHLAILPDACILRTDAALGRNGVDFGDDQSWATSCEAAEMLLVPGSEIAIFGRVPGYMLGAVEMKDGGNTLAHGRDDDAVVQFKTSQFES